MPESVSIYPPSAVVGMLSETIGQEKAQRVVEEAAGALGLSTYGSWNRDDALAVLEKVAETPGLIGITARFVKSRLHMSDPV